MTKSELKAIINECLIEEGIITVDEDVKAMEEAALICEAVELSLNEDASNALEELKDNITGAAKKAGEAAAEKGEDVKKAAKGAIDKIIAKLPEDKKKLIGPAAIAAAAAAAVTAAVVVAKKKKADKKNDEEKTEE